MKPLIGIVIVNWNKKEYLKTCFESIFDQTYKYYRIVLVDNASEDGSVKFVRDNYPAVEIIELEKNLGFGQGMNRGISLLLKDDSIRFIFALNNDVRVENTCLEEIVKATEIYPDADVFACKILFMDKPGIINSRGIAIYRDGTVRDIDIYKPDREKEKVMEVFGACGGVAVYKREILEKVGLFDPIFFSYPEDVDLAWRIRLSGARCLHIPKARVFHKFSGTWDDKSLLKLYQVQKGRLLLLMKHYWKDSPFKAIYATFGPFLPTKRNIKRISSPESFFRKNSKIKQITVYIKAWFDAIKLIPKVLAERKHIESIKKIDDKEIEFWFDHEVKERS